MKKRVLFLLTQDLTSPSGLGRYLPMSKVMVAEGWDLWIAALHGNYEQLKEKRQHVEGVRVEYVAQMHVEKTGSQTKYFGPFRLLWLAILATFRLYRACLLAKPDLIIIGKPHPMNSLAALAYRVFHHCKLVLDVDDLESESNFFQFGLYRKILAFFEKCSPRSVDLVTTNTYFNLERMVRERIPAAKIHYLPNGVDLSRFPDLPESEILDLRKKLGFGDAPVIGYIGSMNLANHSVDLLLEAFALAIQEQPDLRLLLVGGGRDLEKIRRMVSDLKLEGVSVVTGRVKPEEVNLYTRVCTVAVDPVRDSLAERGRCPLKIFEAWAAGVPFITMDVGDRKLLAGEPPAVFISKPDSRHFSWAILLLIRNKSEITLLSQFMASRRQDYSWKSLMNDFLVRLDGLL